MKKQSGFTLIEMVVVIVLLGILAVTAAPKFLNLQSDARISALNGLKGAIVDNDRIYYSKAVIEGRENQYFYEMDVNGETIEIMYGIVHTTGDYSDIIDNQLKSMNADENDWTWATVDGSPAITFANNIDTKNGQRVLKRNCYIKYNVSFGIETFDEPSSKQEPGHAIKTLDVITDGC